MAAYAADPGELLVQTNKFGEFRRLYRWKIGSGGRPPSFTPVSPDLKMDVSDFAIDEARRHVYLEMNDGGYASCASWTRRRTPGGAALPRDADHVSWDRHPRRAVRHRGVETATAPRTSYVWDWQTKSLTQWVVPSSRKRTRRPSRWRSGCLSCPGRHGDPDVRALPERLLARGEQDGRPVPGHRPVPRRPEGQATPVSPEVPALRGRGFIFVEPNVRGSDGYGKAWLDADNGAKRLNVITDIDDCGKWIRANWGRNGKPPKIGITGGSYGGYSTLVGMTMFAGTYDAGVSIVGMGNLVTMLRNTSPYRRILRVTEYGDPEKDSETLLKLSPITYIDRVKSPLLIIQGLERSPRSGGEAVQMQEALEKKGAPSRLILVPEEGHGSTRQKRPGLS